MTAIAKVLDRVLGVRATGPQRWIARCPAHDDRSPSLSIRGIDDGRVLIHCFAGCGAVDVPNSVGLTMADLFEKRQGHLLHPVRGGFSARELLELNSYEISVAADLAAIARLRALTDAEMTRLNKASDRLSKAMVVLRGL